MTINKIKTNVLKQFYGDDGAKKSSKFRLIQSSKFKWLMDDYNVKDAELSENGYCINFLKHPLHLRIQ